MTRLKELEQRLKETKAQKKEVMKFWNKKLNSIYSMIFVEKKKNLWK